MYLKSIRILNMKRIRDLTLEIPMVDGRPRAWTVLIGENGTAKTSILQAIAMAASGASQVNAVAERGVAHLRDRRSENALHLRAEFRFTHGALTPDELEQLHPTWKRDDPPVGIDSTLWLKHGSTTVQGIASYLEDPRTGDIDDPLNQARAVHTRRWFVAAYGVARVLPDSNVTPDLSKPSVDRLKPLFDSRISLASVGFANAFRRRDAELDLPAGKTSRNFAKILNAIIKAGGDDLLPGIRGLELRGSGGTKSAADLIDSDRFRVRVGEGDAKIAGVALSHGFQSTFAWISDLVGHVLLEATDNTDPSEFEGLVLLDEIDLYLHPRWQTTFIRALRRIFPKLQFIATTHSPVVLAGLKGDEIVRLAADPVTGDIQRVSRDPETGELTPLRDGAQPAAEPDPRALTGTEVYEDYFGIATLTLHPHGEEIRHYSALAGDSLRTNEQEREMKGLKRVLERHGVEDLPLPVPRERTA